MKKNGEVTADVSRDMAILFTATRLIMDEGGMNPDEATVSHVGAMVATLMVSRNLKSMLGYTENYPLYNELIRDLGLEMDELAEKYGNDRLLTDFATFN